MLEAQNTYFLTGRNAFLTGDWKLARKQYKAAAKAGSVSALHNLGVMHLHGQGCVVNYARAREYFHESAIHGICESMNQLGYMYYYGKGSAQDFNLARGWFLSSDMNGSHPYAQYHLGIMHALGQSVAQNWKEAAKWLKLSADQGYAPAIYNLGVLYFNGDGVSQSYDQALELYARAAVQGHSASENNFAVMCAEGLGTLKHSIEQVMAFWERAAAKNVSEAHYNLVNIHLTQDLVTSPSRAHAAATEAAAAKSNNDNHRTHVQPAPVQVLTPTHDSPTRELHKSLPTRKNKPVLPPLRPRTSSRRVEIIEPPSPFFEDFHFEKPPRILGRGLARSPTEPNFREVHESQHPPPLPRSASYMQIKPQPVIQRLLPTPEQSPLVMKTDVQLQLPPKRKVRVASLVPTMPPTPES